MEKIIALLSTEPDGTLHPSALETLGAARELATQLGAGFSVGLLGGKIDDAARQAAGADPEKIYGVSGEDFEQSRYATDAAAVEALVKASEATIVLASGTSRFRRCAAGVAARLNGRTDTGVTGISVEDGKVTVHRWYYRQRIEADLTREQRPWFILVAVKSRNPLEVQPREAPVETVPVETAENLKRTKVEGTVAPTTGEQTIRPDAEMLLVAGAGWTKKQADGQAHVDVAEKLILDFIRTTQASLGSSKSLVDLSGEGQAVISFMTHLNQVGQTGSTPRHPKGLATCCHGEEPHAVGWRFITERRAINKDPNCGWAQGKADVLYIADAFEVMEKVNSALKQGV